MTERVEVVEVALRRLRLLGAAVAVALLAGLRAPAGPASPALLVGVPVTAIAINLLSLLAARARPPAARTLRALELVADAALALLVAAPLATLDTGLAWIVLLLPVLEGALRHGMRGVVLVWLWLGTAYTIAVLVPLWPPSAATETVIVERLDVVVDRLGLLLLVAVPVGYLGEQVLGALVRQRSARREAKERSELMAGVLAVARRVTDLDAGIPDAVVKGVAGLGYDAADFSERDPRTGEWTTTARWFEGATLLPALGKEGALLALALDRGSTAVLEPATATDEERAVLARHGLGALIVTPVGDGRGETVLRAGIEAGSPFSRHRAEALDLLARQVGTALRNRQLVGRLHAARDRLQFQADHDPLTGLPNRSRFQRAVLEALRRGRNPVALLLLDLDHFKDVNDALGHAGGDRLLMALAERVRQSVRGGAEVARFGGDEFTVLTRVRDEEAAVALARRVSRVLSRPFAVDGREVVATASVGIAVAGRGEVQPEELLRRADVAMYAAKQRGPGNWQLYAPGLERVSRERLRVEADLRAALAAGDLRLAYQPVVRTRDRRVVGMEALLRWRDADRGDVAPAEFIPVAEDSGLIVDVGRWVLEEACTQAQRWRGVRRPPAWTSVNVSPRQLTRPEFVGEVGETLRATALDPSLLVLEVTERVLADTQAWQHLEAIRDLGVRLAIDDFGAGHTSLRYLRRAPFDMLKIDSDFVQSTRARPADRAILGSIVSLARDLGMVAVAEGVETRAQLERLRALGCEAFQGHLFSPPVDAEHATALLVTRGSGRARARVGRPSTRAAGIEMARSRA